MTSTVDSKEQSLCFRSNSDGGRRVAITRVVGISGSRECAEQAMVDVDRYEVVAELILGSTFTEAIGPNTGEGYPERFVLKAGTSPDSSLFHELSSVEADKRMIENSMSTRTLSRVLAHQKGIEILKLGTVTRMEDRRLPINDHVSQNSHMIRFVWWLHVSHLIQDAAYPPDITSPGIRKFAVDLRR